MDGIDISEIVTGRVTGRAVGEGIAEPTPKRASRSKVEPGA